jgi:hypothetical protein
VGKTGHGHSLFGQVLSVFLDVILNRIAVHLLRFSKGDENRRVCMVFNRALVTVHHSPFHDVAAVTTLLIFIFLMHNPEDSLETSWPILEDIKKRENV